jgi:endonuclease/exonuclease/phosphatase family metal-dependent hydrolase
MTSAPRRFLRRRASRNYTHPSEPRYAGGELPASVPASAIKVVTFNVKFAKQLSRAVTLLSRAPALREPDVLLLQEMDAPGAAAIAGGLGMAYVYYPNTVHPVAHKDFGCAILSRFPIADDRKILLPHLARFRGIQRAAVAATIRIGSREVRVYNVHLATMVDNGPRQRREQLGAVLEDADRFPQVVLSGDFNSDRVPEIALARGYTWPTRGLGPTNAIWALDHILLKGLELTAPTAFGAVRDSSRASDHKPVWARIHLGAEPATS